MIHVTSRESAVSMIEAQHFTNRGHAPVYGLDPSADSLAWALPMPLLRKAQLSLLVSSPGVVLAGSLVIMLPEEATSCLSRPRS